MKKRSVILTATCVLSLSVFSFGQSKANKNMAALSCQDSAKAVVWRSLRQKNGADEFGTCKEQLRTKVIKLGNREGYFVRFRPGLCGVTGNCQSWVLLKDRNRLKIILSLEALEKIEMKRTRNNNQPLLMFRYHMSASEYYLSTFRFTGRSLDFIRCQLETYNIDRKHHTSKVSKEYCLD
jgi:hypothetical protein